MTKLRVTLLLIGLFIAFVTINNASWLAEPRSGEMTLLAHRGMAQTFSRDNLTAETCTATRIFQPEHPYLEGTIASTVDRGSIRAWS
jgi:glycerophosphoryl diester phosphodiesterase